MELMNTIPDGSVDFILDDLPYAVTNAASEAGQWDELIPFGPMWEQFWRVLKPNGAVVLFAQGMFTAQLMMSQPKCWRYNLIWDKCRASGFLNANRMPLRYHEDICVFYRELPTYNPQLEDLNGREPNHFQGNGEHKKHESVLWCRKPLEDSSYCRCSRKEIPWLHTEVSSPTLHGQSPDGEKCGSVQMAHTHIHERGRDGAGRDRRKRYDRRRCDFRKP